jgi:hypothetical protein
VTGDGVSPAITRTVTDRAGNTASVTVSGLKIDLTAPAVTPVGAISGAVYSMDKIPAVSCPTTDATSGVTAQAAAVTSRDARGLYTVTCSGGTDVAGNRSQPRSISFTVKPSVVALTVLTYQYVTMSGSSNANGVFHSLIAQLAGPHTCSYISRVDKEAHASRPALTVQQAAELSYWARVLDPTCS